MVDLELARRSLHDLINCWIVLDYSGYLSDLNWLGGSFRPNKAYLLEFDEIVKEFFERTSKETGLEVDKISYIFKQHLKKENVEKIDLEEFSKVTFLHMLIDFSIKDSQS